MTNADKIRAMPSDQIANYIDCPYQGKYCREYLLNVRKYCQKCKQEWLDTVIDEPKEEPQKPKVPSLIDRPNFERQLESFSIKAFVQQFKYLACKINEIIKYLEEIGNDN